MVKTPLPDEGYKYNYLSTRDNLVYNIIQLFIKDTTGKDIIIYHYIYGVHVYTTNTSNIKSRIFHHCCNCVNML